MKSLENLKEQVKRFFLFLKGIPMTVRKLSQREKIILSLITNLMLFGVILGLRLLGLPTITTVLILTVVVFLEVIYFVFSIWISVAKDSQRLEALEKNIESIRENEEKAQTALIYIGHQMKALQHELESMKKGHILKTNGHNHRPKAQA